MKTKSSFSQSPGFTLIEILLVLVVLSIIVGLAIPNFSNLHRQLLIKRVAYEISYLMQRAQTRTMSQGYELRITSDANRSSFWIEQKKDNSYTRMPGELNRTVDIPPEMHVEAEGLPILFLPNGGISQGEISVCNEEECFLVSTKVQYGNVKISKWSAK
ncbi:MAG: prepilin-type N-terminal cleavage/methylation domain-containing protein [Candidatus Omnitrophica bacterium]|nr:prepilin-type N-terminal cleavage/methylation domain-containing protein [Candidatus Omnitrophota bacterium]